MNRPAGVVQAALLLIVSTIWLASAAQAQFRASLRGTVIDIQGAVVSGATVTLTNKNTNAKLTSTKTKSGDLVIATWNLVAPGQRGAIRGVTFVFSGLPSSAHATLQRVDSEHGNVLPEYAAMGSPLDPTPLQVAQLNRKTALPVRSRCASRTTNWMCSFLQMHLC